MRRRVHNKNILKNTRKKLRNNATKAERLLWQYLKKSQLGYKFRRQQSIDRYIVDFYCPALQLIVELDGYVHGKHSVQLNDREREERLIRLGFTVVRYRNEQVLYELKSVLVNLHSICHNIHT